MDQDHTLGPSGLRRIRRQPPSRVSTLPSPEASSIGFRDTPLTASGVTSRSASVVGTVPLSPGLEDLHRFPTESLHSFSFAHQSEESLHNRQNILKKSVDFMRDRLGWAATSAGLASVQAKISGDDELQSMMELLRKANVIGVSPLQTQRLSPSHGPLTGPADVDGFNIFEKSFSKKTRPAGENSLGSSELDQVSSQQEKDDEGSPGFASRVDKESSDPKSAPISRRGSLKRTYTDLSAMSLQAKLVEALAQPYSSKEQDAAINMLSGHAFPPRQTTNQPATSSSVHSHSSKWAPVSQAVFRTEAADPWTILAANDLACLVFGVTRAEVRKLSVLEIIHDEQRAWLEGKLRDQPLEGEAKSRINSTTKLLGSRGGITAQLLSKTPSRQKVTIRRAQTDDGVGGYYRSKVPKNHASKKSRGVLLCGDVLPIKKRDGATGSASFWVMEKRGGLIWVIEEILEDTVCLKLDENNCIAEASGDIATIWGEDTIEKGCPVAKLLPRLPQDFLKTNHDRRPLDSRIQYFAAQTLEKINVPTRVTQLSDPHHIRISSFPHIAGVMVLSPETLSISSSNTVFSAALFGYSQLENQPITNLIPGFDSLLGVMTEEDDVELIDGLVIPEHSFRRARALLAFREGSSDAANIFNQPSGIPAKHRDGSEITVDIQMRVVKSESIFPAEEDAITEKDEDLEEANAFAVQEVVYALWITYSRQLHSRGVASPRPEPSMRSRPITPPRQPSPRDDVLSRSPEPALSTSSKSAASSNNSSARQIQEATSQPIGDEPLEHPSPENAQNALTPPKKKTIHDFVILEQLGAGAYGEVKLVRYKKDNAKKMVLKYVTKRRILVDTWTRDRKLGTVPLEIHVMDYLRRDGLKHPNIVEMVDFFEDDVNYYIEMLPHGIPGMDLFDYIELRANMEEEECRNIFKQVVDAIHHLHTKALVVHRDIKDENVVLDGEGKIKLIDFGSAAYIKNGPFDVFVGTIDYAAPEVLQGRSYRGKEQDVWALGILLYTIVYKENPFYNVEEILDHPLRVPFLPFSEDCIDLIRKMLDRDVDERITITEVMEHPWMLVT
ncbi:MAG: hypothetical protein Q9160_006396 [Pyrenula sp. 1 TL-2023]